MSGRRMEWDCKNGTNCFNLIKRIRLGVFDECFSRGIGYTDIDAFVEIDRSFGIQEWKGPGKLLPTGQRIAFQRFTENNNNSVLIVDGDARTMTVNSYYSIDHGEVRRVVPSDLKKLKEHIKTWRELVEGKKILY
jgi:hypothetical protein